MQPSLGTHRSEATPPNGRHSSGHGASIWQQVAPDVRLIRRRK